MECLICNQDKTMNDAVILSQKAFIQVLPLLIKENNNEFGRKLNLADTDSAVYICKNCFLTVSARQL